MKNVLVFIHDDVGQEARLRAALDVTGALRGRLTCLDVSTARVRPGDDTSAADLMLLDQECRTEATNRARLRQRLAAQDVPWRWVDATGNLEASLEEAAAGQDLIVVSRHSDLVPDPDLDRAVAALVVRAGKPVMAIPDGAAGLDLAGNALVAWDGSPAAAAALHAAIPLLRLAGSVTLLEIDDGSVSVPAEAAAADLGRAGVRAAVERRPAGLERASAHILDEAGTGRHAWLVMGGFGHSRFLEAIFGGVTRRMLNASPIPLFLAH